MTTEQRVIELSRIPKGYLTTTPPLPTSCKVETSSRCNNKCKDCAASMVLRPQGDMDITIFWEVLSKTLDASIEEIGLFLLGNPLLNPRIYQMVSNVRECRGKPFITISAYDLCPDVIIKLCDAGIKSIKVSAGNEIPIERSITWSAGYCAARDVSFSASIIVKSRIIPFEWYKKHYYENFVDLYGLPLHNCAGRIDNGGRGCPGTWDNPAPLTPCYPLFRGFYVDWRGRNTLCPICHDETMLNGSLLDNTVLELWHSEFACDLREQHLCGNITNKTCKACLGL